MIVHLLIHTRTYLLPLMRSSTQTKVPICMMFGRSSVTISSPGVFCTASSTSASMSRFHQQPYFSKCFSAFLSKRPLTSPYHPLPCSSRMMRPVSGLTADAKLHKTATGSDTEQSPNVCIIVSYVASDADEDKSEAKRS